MIKHSALPDMKLTSNMLSLLRVGLSKTEVAALAEDAVAALLEGGNVFGVAETIAAMEEFTKTVRRDERYIQYLRDELAKHQGRLKTASGALVEMCEAGISYDYSYNSEWLSLDDQIKALQQQKKSVEEKLRSVAPGKIAVDTETGEVIEGAFKTSKSTYRLTLAK